MQLNTVPGCLRTKWNDRMVAAVLLSACLLSPISAQDKAEELKPVPLKHVFTHDFSKDTRGQFNVKGKVAWTKGELKLSPGASIGRGTQCGARARLELEVEWPPLTIIETESVLHVTFALQGNAVSDVLIRRKLIDGDVATSIAFGHATIGSQDKDANTQFVGKKVAPPGNKLSIEYRHGWLEVKSGKRVLTRGYVPRTLNAVRGFSVRSIKQPTSVKSVKLWTRRRLYPPLKVEQVPAIRALNRKIAEHGRLHAEGKYLAAVRLGETIVRDAERIFGKTHLRYALQLNNLANAYFALGRLEKAETWQLRSLAIGKWAVGQHHPFQLAALHNLAQLHIQRRDRLGALPYADKAWEICRTVLRPVDPRSARILQTLGQIHAGLRNWKRAESLLEQSMAMTNRKVDPNTYVYRLRELADVFRSQGDSRRAEPMLLQALEISRSFGELHPEIAHSLRHLADLYSHRGEHRRAEELLRQELEIQKATYGEKHKFVASNWQRIALQRWFRHDLAGTQQAHEKALAILKVAVGKDHSKYAWALKSLARVHERRGNFREAERLIEQFIDLLTRAAKKKNDHGASLFTLGGIYFAKQDYKQAESYYEQSLAKLPAEKRDRGAHATRLGALAKVRSATGRFKNAEALFSQVMAIRNATRGKGSGSYHPELNDLAVHYEFKGDAERATSLWKRMHDSTLSVLEENASGQSERQQKRSQARNNMNLQMLISNILRTHGNAEDLLESAVWRRKGVVTLRQRAYRQVAGHKELKPLFDELRSVTQQLSLAIQKAPLLPNKSASRWMQDDYQRRRKQWEQRRAKLTREREVLQRKIAAKSESFRRLNQRLRAGDLRKRLRAGTAYVDFLEYPHWDPSPHLTQREDRFVAFVVRKDKRVEMVALASAAKTAGWISDFRRQFTNRANTKQQRKAALEAGEQLRKQLWEPLERHLSGINTVILSPDTSLGTLPFSCLPGKKPGTFLVEDYRLARLPFANLLPELMDKKAVEGEPSLLVLGDAAFDTKLAAVERTAPRSNLANRQGVFTRAENRRNGKQTQWSPLPGFSRELAIVKALHQERFADAKVHVLAQQTATEDLFLSTAPSYRTLHLVTHGYFAGEAIKSIDQVKVAVEEGGVTEDSPSLQLQSPDPFVNTWLPGLLSGLVMAGANQANTNPRDLNDGILRAAEIETVSLQGVDLVVLSACETGLGQVAGGEGLTGLQRAFQIAGARSVVASLWKVEDKATQELIRRFYDNLWNKKMSKLDALREAQLWMLKHPQQLVDLGVKGALTRGKPRDLKKVKPVSPAKDRTHPYYWAAFQLSGDWR